MPASSTVTNCVNSLLTQTLLTQEPLMSKVCRSSFWPPDPVLVSFLLPTGEEGRLRVSRKPEPCLVTSSVHCVVCRGLPAECVDAGGWWGGVNWTDAEADHVLMQGISVGLAATGPPGPRYWQWELPPGWQLRWGGGNRASLAFGNIFTCQA